MHMESTWTSWIRSLQSLRMSSALESSYVGILWWMMTSRSSNLHGGSGSMQAYDGWWLTISDLASQDHYECMLTT